MIERFKGTFVNASSVRPILGVLALIFLPALCAAADELIIDVYPDEAHRVIERNKIQYEELRRRSFPGRVRIARINTELLLRPGAEFSITPFMDVPAITVKGQGFEKRKWTGIKIQGGIPEEELRAELQRQGTPDSIVDQVVQLFNLVELRATSQGRALETGATVRLHREYEPVRDGERIGEVFGTAPVYSEQLVSEATEVRGDINIIDPAVAPKPFRTFSIRPLDNDPDYVVIYEWDK